jgi:phosphate:Na+ symporter
VALLLGADVGTSLVVQVLSFDLSWLIPVLLAAGGWLFLKHEARTVKQIGRILIGIAFILIALGMIGQAMAPLEQSPFMPAVARHLSKDFVTAFLAAALFTWLAHSSVAAVLMIMQFVGQGVLPIDAGFSLLLGANAGGALIAVWLTRGYDREARLLPLTNLVFRVMGTVLVLAASRYFTIPFDEIGALPARQIANLHLLFNAGLLVVCLPLIGPVNRLVARLVPKEQENRQSDEMPSPRDVLDRNVIGTPQLALASATRATLRMAGIVEMMLRPVMELFETGDKERMDRIRELDKQVNQAHTDIKLYIAEINRGQLSSEDATRGVELTGLAINLERAGDIVAKNLVGLIAEKHKRRLKFSTEGWRELTDMHARVMNNMQTALNVVISEDVESARQLVVEKDRMRKLERDSYGRHLDRLRSGEVESIESSDLHLETVRSLREINSLMAAVAYPILSRHGQLRETRLKKVS